MALSFTHLNRAQDGYLLHGLASWPQNQMDAIFWNVILGWIFFKRIKTFGCIYLFLSYRSMCSDKCLGHNHHHNRDAEHRWSSLYNFLTLLLVLKQCMFSTNCTSNFRFLIFSQANDLCDITLSWDVGQQQRTAALPSPVWTTSALWCAVSLSSGGQ